MMGGRNSLSLEASLLKNTRILKQYCADISLAVESGVTQNSYKKPQNCFSFRYDKLGLGFLFPSAF